MSTLHTPGPWHWNGNTLEPVEKDPNTSAVYSILDREGGYGFLGSDHQATAAELEANYQLIAAAPDLLRELQRLLAAYRQAVKLHDPNTDDAYTVDAHNAIAKAIGGVR